MFDVGLNEESIASIAQHLLSMSLLTKEGHFTHAQITEMYIAIYKKLKAELLQQSNSDE